MSDASAPGIIEVSGLKSGYDGVTVLKGLDFHVGSEVFAVLGANGAGKTTLLATLAKLVPPMGEPSGSPKRTSPTCARTRQPNEASPTYPRSRACSRP